MLSFFLSYLLIHKYTLLFFVLAGASFGMPLPATALLMAAGAFAAQGYFDLYIILLCGFFATVIGDMSGYILSGRYGRGAFMRIGFKKLILSPRFETMETLFVQHSIKAIFFTRFLASSLGPAVNILAGFTKISFSKFLFYDLLGEFIYVVLFVGLGYIFGDQWEVISDISGDVTTIIVLIIVLIILFTLIWRATNSKK